MLCILFVIKRGKISFIYFSGKVTFYPVYYYSALVKLAEKLIALDKAQIWHINIII